MVISNFQQLRDAWMLLPLLELIASTRVMNCREISIDMEVKAEISIFYVSCVIIGR